MCMSLLAMSLISHPAAAFAVLGLFFIGILAAEPAKEMLVSSLADSRARAAYTGTSRIGMAIGGASGHLGGGWLMDCARQLHHPALPWLTLSAVGLLTLYALSWLLAPHRPLRMRLAQI
jgi:DHA1 family multidrug resistance protein-like MFS transporter